MANKRIRVLHTSPTREDAWYEAHKLAKIVTEHENAKHLSVGVEPVKGVYHVILYSSKEQS